MAAAGWQRIIMKALRIGSVVTGIASSTLLAAYCYNGTENGNMFSFWMKSHCLQAFSTEVERRQSTWDWDWDKRDTKDVVDHGPKAISKKHYIFIRHGQYNVNGYDDTERYLTKLGREQAKMTGERLAKLGLQYTRLVQSSMTRAIETCNIITEQIPNLPAVETSDLLREGAPIPPDPSHRANETELKYFSDAPRIEAAFRKFVHRPNTPHNDSVDEPVELYVCHANVIRYFICRVAQFPPQGWLRMSLKHGSITWVTVFSDGSTVINCVGDSGYMPSTKLSS